MLLPSDFDCELDDWMIILHPTSFLSNTTSVGAIKNDKKGQSPRRPDDPDLGVAHAA